MPRTRKKPHQLIAESLKTAKAIAKDNVIKSEALGRADRERLLSAQFLTEVIRGWYLLGTPDGGGVSTAWFGSFWAFIKHYMVDRFGEGEFCISAESSLNMFAGDTAIPRQIIILTKKDSNTTIDLLHDTSIFLRTDTKNFPTSTAIYNQLPVMSAVSALCRVGPSYFQQHPKNVEVILKLASVSTADISRNLLKLEAVTAAERLIGAYRHLNDLIKADQILKDMQTAGYKISPVNPFADYLPQLLEQRITSPHAGRIRIKWNEMKKVVEKIFPTPPGISGDQSKTINVIWETYKQDAYHSLSIEGYHVTESLIEKIEKGIWDPENNDSDRKQKDALAAKGYFQSFQTVTKSIERVLKHENSSQVLETDLQTWYRELFAPLLQANLEPAEKLAGYRNQQVYITGSRHIPPQSSAVLDCMDVLFELLRNESNAAVRAVLGHFIFVYIHPYMDGNGRIGRFIMNLMLVSGGYNWTVIRVERRSEYMAALERASTEDNIEPFATFVASELNHWKTLVSEIKIKT